jgi:PAS domain S-box-containing protein
MNQQSATHDPLHALFDSVLGTLNGFAFRCKGIDSSFEMTNISPSGFFRLTGYKADDFIGPDARRWNSLLHPSDLDDLEAKQRLELANKGTWAYFYRIRRADGCDIWVHETGWTERDPDTHKDVLIGMILDASTVKRAEEKESIFRERIATISNHTVAMVRLLDRLRLLSLNARIEAARAGQAGQGFEQVSAEMKTLADRASSLLSGIEKQDSFSKAMPDHRTAA